MQLYLFLILALLCLPLNTTAQHWKSAYQRVTELEDQTFLVKRFDKQGVVNQDGQVLLQVKYDTVLVFPRGYVVEETKNNATQQHLISKTGETIYTFTSSRFLLPYDDPSWKNAANRIPIARRVAGVFDAKDYHSILPYNYRYIHLMGSSDHLFWVGNEEEQWAVVDSSNQHISGYIYSRISSPHNEGQHSKIEFMKQNNFPERYLSNWAYRHDTLVCLSSITGKEIWESTKARKVLYCDKGLHLVQFDNIINPDYVIIDEVTQTVTKLGQYIKKIHTYLGNGRFYASLNDGRHGIIDLNGNLQKEYPYKEVREIPRVKSYYIPDQNLDFSDYVYATDDNATYLWSPTTDHRIKIDEAQYSLQHYNLIPIARSRRQWCLIEPSSSEYLDNDLTSSILSFSRLIIVDSISRGIVYTKKYNGNKLYIDLENSSPDHNVWITNENFGSHIHKYKILYDNKTLETNENDYIKKLSPDGRFYLINSIEFNGAHTNNARVFDTQKGDYVKYDIKNAVFFGDKGFEKFMIQYKDKEKILRNYLTNVDFNENKTIDLNKVNYLEKKSLGNNPQNSALEINISTSDHRYLSGVLDADGNIVLPIEYERVFCIYNNNNKYAFLLKTKDNYNELINYDGQKIPYYRYHKIADSYLNIRIDSVYFQVFNYKTGALSQKFKQNSARTFLIKELCYIIEHISDKISVIHKVDEQNPATAHKIECPDYINPHIIFNYETGESEVGWHSINYYYESYIVVYRNQRAYVNWEGHCVEGCD